MPKHPSKKTPKKKPAKKPKGKKKRPMTYDSIVKSIYGPVRIAEFN